MLDRFWIDIGKVTGLFSLSASAVEKDLVPAGTFCSVLSDILRNRTGKLSDVLAMEQEIQRVRGEIEQMTAQMESEIHRHTLPQCGGGRLSQRAGKCAGHRVVDAIEWPNSVAVAKRAVLSVALGVAAVAGELRQLGRSEAYEVPPAAASFTRNARFRFVVTISPRYFSFPFTVNSMSCFSG